MGDAPVLFEVSEDGVVCVVSLNRPQKKNALNNEILNGLQSSLEEVRKRPKLRILVLRGEGGDLSGGFDLETLNTEETGGDDGDRLHGDGGWKKVVDMLEDLPLVKIADLGGHVTGGGVVLALCCDFRVCDDTTVLRLPEVPMGLPLLWGGLGKLCREVGVSRARRWVMLGQVIRADELSASGFAEKAGEEGAASRVRSIVKQLADTNPFAVALSRAQLRAAGDLLLNSRALSFADVDLMTLSKRDEGVQAHLLKYVAQRTARRSKL